MDYQELLAAYDYPFPSELVAKEPAHPRDTARLLIYDRKRDSIAFDAFSNVGKYLPKKCVIVLNNTKVLPAKFSLRKSTGGRIDVLFLRSIDDAVEVIASGKLQEGEIMTHASGIKFKIFSRESDRALIKAINFDQDFYSFLEKYGETPLPPYMKNSPMSEPRRREEYQTVFAQKSGSVAAPTAGLHFTKNLIKKLEHSGRTFLEVTLHVNRGTFASLTEENLRINQLHSECYFINEETLRALNEAKKSGIPIIAVGTTSVRTLESACSDGQLGRMSGDTRLFIREETPLQFVDHLITNFHVPKSSLLMLVSAFTGRKKLLEIYRKAIDDRFRLFSFGDAMMIL